MCGLPGVRLGPPRVVNLLPAESQFHHPEEQGVVVYHPTYLLLDEVQLFPRVFGHPPRPLPSSLLLVSLRQTEQSSCSGSGRMGDWWVTGKKPCHSSPRMFPFLFRGWTGVSGGGVGGTGTVTTVALRPSRGYTRLEGSPPTLVCHPWPVGLVSPLALDVGPTCLGDGGTGLSLQSTVGRGDRSRVGVRRSRRRKEGWGGDGRDRRPG